MDKTNYALAIDALGNAGVQAMTWALAGHTSGFGDLRAGQMFWTGRFSTPQREQVLFYSINPGMYDCFTRGLEIEVVNGGTVGTGTGVVADAEWSLQ